MKITGYKVCQLLLITAFCFISGSVISRDVKQTRKERKEAKKAERLKDYETLGTMLGSRAFVYSTDRVQGSTGVMVYNTIRVDGTRVSVRLEDPPNTSGWNSGVKDNSSPVIGPRGIFFEGDIAGWELSGNPKGNSYNLKFDLVTTGKNPGGNLVIEMKVNADKSASVEIKGRAGGWIYSNYTGKIWTL